VRKISEGQSREYKELELALELVLELALELALELGVRMRSKRGGAYHFGQKGKYMPMI